MNSSIEEQHEEPLVLFPYDDIEENINTTEITRTRSLAEIESVSRQLSQTNKSEIPYSMLSQLEKTAIVLLVAFIGMFSAILQPIYLPILTLLQHRFNVSEEMMNMSVVLYLIFQGVSPTLMSNFADKIGRRPVILICLCVYIAANVGLALTNVYWLLLVLRCCQLLGIAPVISINSGVVGDVTQRFERGTFIGAAQGITLVGQGFGALIGAALLNSPFGWRSIFWFLAILPGVVLVFAFFCLPETKRSIVGNISVVPKRFINRAPILLAPFFRSKLVNQTESVSQEKSKFDILSLFKIMLLPEVACALFPSSIVFTTWTMSLTTYTTILLNEYHYKTLHIGLSYLPSGLGSLVGSLVCGRILDRVYRIDKENFEKQYPDIETRPNFNIYRARLKMFLFPCISMTVFTVIFGWTLEYHESVAIVMVSMFFMSFSTNFPVTMCTTVLVDIFPGKSSTSTSLVNFSRCVSSLVGVAVLSRMESSMQVGGCYTFMAALCMLGNVFIYLCVAKGQKWQEKREEKLRQREKTVKDKSV